MDIIALIIALASTLVSVIVIVLYIKQSEKIANLKEDFRVELDDLHDHIQSLRKQLDEIIIGSIGLNNKFDSLTENIEKLNETQEELKLQDPESKLYSRARKMIELGAGIDEVVTECEIPKSEAELLFSVAGKDVAPKPIAQKENKPQNIAPKPIGQVAQPQKNSYMNFNAYQNSNMKINSAYNIPSTSDEVTRDEIYKDSGAMPSEAQGLMDAFKK
ncbi:MAG: DUF2802 domain-containing protein [Succinivibrionaceae bacterium]|nr:DUF2802 domain-containing protein [Ruminobacter sp.]MDY5778393.1 DUF2802 domain-containing protein [Succinivibrionaceae bacterium]MEE1339255.1 DUF2802 domain-containing protein [Succinivibrionaceae bacterium]